MNTTHHIFLAEAARIARRSRRRMAVALVPLTLALFLPARLAATQPIELEVPVASPWYDTGIDISAGQRLTVFAAGCVWYGANLPQNTDANGVGGKTDGTMPAGPDGVAPGAIRNSLIGKIGGTTNIGTGKLVPEGLANHGAGFVGAAYSQVLSNSGRLFLGYNDYTNKFYDNSGVFFVDVWTNNPTGTTNAGNAVAVEICWPSVTNEVYVVQYAPAVEANRWTDLGLPARGNGTTNWVFDSTRGRSERFYRVLKIQ